MMRKVPIDLRELAWAMSAGGFGEPSSLNMDTGEIRAPPPDEMDSEELDERPADTDRGRWVVIPKESHETYQRMARFVASIEEEDVRERLEIAIQGKGAFHRFRDVLSGFPDLREAWHRQEELAALESAKEWLATLGIEADWTPPPPHVGKPSAAPKVRVGIEHVLALGSPEGKTEIVQSRVHRGIVAGSREEARRLYEGFVRQLAGWCGLSYRKRMASEPVFEAGGIRVRLEGTEVDVSLEVPQEVRRWFWPQ